MICHYNILTKIVSFRLSFVQMKFQLKNLILKGVMEPSESERGAEAHEVRRSAE